MKDVLLQPETPVEEEWYFQTDVHVSDDGTEQRISLSPVPKRTLRTTYGIDAKEDVRAMAGLVLAGVREPYRVAWWHQQARISAVAAALGSTVSFNSERTDLRAGQTALLAARNGTRELVVIDTVAVDGCTLAEPLVNSFPAGSLIIPVWTMYSNGGANLSRNVPDYAATLSLVSNDVGFMIPFVDEWAETELTTLGGLPVLDINAIGNSFDVGSDTGTEWTDYGGVVEWRDRRKHSQLILPRSFLCQRVLDLASWSWWRSFADYTRGSLNPFWLPSFREDFDIAVAPTPGGTTLRFDGRDYYDDYFALAPFKAVCIRTAAGIHYATVTAAAIVSGDTQITFSPALPSGSGWGDEQRVELMSKVRISDDKFVLRHTSLDTTITLTLRTVDA